MQAIIRRCLTRFAARLALATALALSVLLGAALPDAAHAQKWSSAAPIPVGAEEVYGIAAGGKLYVFGGLAPGWKPMGMVFEYDPAGDRWTRKRDKPAFLHHVALATVNGKIYMFGGFELPAKGAPAWAPLGPRLGFALAMILPSPARRAPPPRSQGAHVHIPSKSPPWQPRP